MEKPKYVLVDSNVWIALHHESDTLHEKAKQIFQKFEAENTTALVTDYIIQEVFSVIIRISGQTAALAYYDHMVGLNRVESIDMNSFFLQKIIQFIRKKNLLKPLGLVDYSIIFFSHLVECPLISFDQQLNKAAQKSGATLA